MCLCGNFFFFKDFSGTTPLRILKFRTNVGYDLYCVKENQPPPAYHSLYYSPILKKSGGYTGFALPFHHSVILSFRNLSNENF